MTKKEILKLVDSGEVLVKTFLINSYDYKIGNKEITKRQAESLITYGLVKYDHSDHNGLTKHYYKKS